MRSLRLTSIFALLCALLLAAAGPALAGNPPENIPLGSEPSSCSAEASAACEEWVVTRLDAARKQLGLSPYELPAGFVGMAGDRQLLILSDLDRVAYGYTPVYGLNTNLTEAAQAGVRKRADPTPPSAGGPWDGFGSDWASAGGLIGYYLWMYDDGYGGPNEDCTSPSASGCWGHRHVILGEGISIPQPELMGAASEAGSGSALIVSSNGGTSAYYTWAQAQREGAGSEGSGGGKPAPAPAVTALSPASGPATGGTHVTITGTELGAVDSVHFGSAQATSFKVVSSTSIVAVAPAGSGAVEVTVTSAAGTSAKSAADVFTYRPVVTRITPASGPSKGGTRVTITGAGLEDSTSAPAVRFGPDAATVSCPSSSECTALAPAHASGTVQVRLTLAGLTSAQTTADRYIYT